MTIKEWPSLEKPHEKLLSQGANALSNAELLAIFIRTGIPGKTAVDLGRELLSHYGNLRDVLHAPFQEISKHEGIGLKKYILLQAVLALSERYLEEKIESGPLFLDSNATKNYLISKLRHYEHEVFACLLLDTQYRLIVYKELFQGSLEEAPIYPREIIKYVLGYNAAAMIISHNHPKGDPEPSQLDIEITSDLETLFLKIGVKLCDHIIVGNNQIFSFAEHSLL